MQRVIILAMAPRSNEQRDRASSGKLVPQEAGVGARMPVSCACADQEKAATTDPSRFSLITPFSNETTALRINMR